MARLILDTGVLIEAQRGRVDLDRLLDDEADVAICSITVMELLGGLEATRGELAEQLREFVNELLVGVPVIDYTVREAREHARLIDHARRKGRPRGAYDCMIAATARASGRTLLTTDAAADFGSLPGIVVRVVRPSGAGTQVDEAD